VGGATYSDLTNLQTDGTGSWLVGDSITGNVSCNLDQGTSMATCTGTQNATFQAMVCSSCTIPNVSASDNYACSKGYGLEADQKTCNYVDPSKANHYEFCPPGSLYDNALQNCVDNVTNKLASPCPPGNPIFSPDTHRCLIKAQAVFNCQTFPMNLGACIPPKQAAIKVVPFCQNNEASMGGANITYPAGSTLSVDTQGSHLQSCTPGGTQPAGTQLFTCFGVAGNGFDVQLCKDPATCTTYHATLGLVRSRRINQVRVHLLVLRCVIQGWRLALESDAT
jgi:hypothetical protein